MVKVIGWLGTGILIVTYGLNSFGYIDSESLWYPLLNLIAAIFLGIRVFSDRNYSNLILEIFWGAIAVIAIFSFLF